MASTVCFSAEVSFAAAGVVGAVGLVGLRGVRRPGELVLGTLPLAFAVHQAAEGVTWTMLGDGAEICSGPSVRVWVVFAWVLVPLWLSLGLTLVEPDRRRRLLMGGLVGVGLLGAPLWLHLALDPRVVARVVPGPHLEYPMPDLSYAWLVAPYLLVALVPALRSSWPTLRLLGLAGVATLLLAVVIQMYAWPSLWCVAAAGLSVLLVVHLQRRDEPVTLSPGAPAAAPSAGRARSLPTADEP